MYNNIPSELRSLNQWVVWRYKDVKGTKPTKVPYDAKTGLLASVNDPSTWCSFEVVISVVVNYSGIGFVFTNDDKFTFIDLDDCRTLVNGEPNPTYEADAQRQIHIFQEFDSYSEVSPSGNGLHIIIKGKVPSGRRRAFIEVYSSGRYATFTGNVYNNKTEIKEQQEKLTQLWEQMGGSEIPSVVQSQAQFYDDNQIINQALNAVNGDVFKILLEGKWQNNYPSQSEADLAFVNIIWFYSKNSEQTERIYRNSVLGNTDKKRKRADYISRMITKSADKDLPKVDIEGYTANIEDIKARIRPLLSTPANSIVPPPGLLGEIAQFIYQAAPRPVPEIALAGAIGLMAGICGRAYNVSNTGLNQYILLLAKTGMGKEGMASGIDKLMSAALMQVPTANDFIGPSHIASGQALVKYVYKKSQSFVSILGEFGLTIQNISSARANPHEIRLKQELLAIYQKSGFTDIYRPSIQADQEKNTDNTYSPAFSILGESTPHSFYSALSEDMITEGLLPRFLLIEYNGIRVEENPNHATIKPEPLFVGRFASLMAHCQQLMHFNPRRCINVEFTPEAKERATQFDRFATSQINETSDEVLLNLWNRAHLKSIKLAALVAVGCDMNYPLIQLDILDWSIKMICGDIRSLSIKFERGEIGSNSSEMKQTKEVVRVIKDYISSDWDKLKPYEKAAKDLHQLHKKKVIPYTYINKRLAATTTFKNDRMGSTIALKRSLQMLIDGDNIQEINKIEMQDKFKTTQRAFIITNLSMFDE